MSDIFSLLFKLKSGTETKDKISPLFIFINIPAPPILLKIFCAFNNSFLIINCRSLSKVSIKLSLPSFNFTSKDFSIPEIPLLLSSICPITCEKRFLSGYILVIFFSSLIDFSPKSLIF